MSTRRILIDDMKISACLNGVYILLYNITKNGLSARQNASSNKIGSIVQFVVIFLFNAVLK